MPSSRRNGKHRLYEDPRLYDLAFAFRDVDAECDGLLEIAAEHGVTRPKRVLELACGPGHHLREFARRGLVACGVDLSADMLGYAEQLLQRDGLSARLERADMRSFAIRPKADIALCLFDSFAHCVTDEDGVEALRSAGASTRRGGLFILEVTHPADYFNRLDRRTVSRWTHAYADVTVKAGHETSRFDAVAETYEATLTIEARYRGGGRPRSIVSRQQHRMWLRSAIANIAARSGAYEIVGWYGDLETRAPLSMRDDAWRMVAVLRRR